MGKKRLVILFLILFTNYLFAQNREFTYSVFYESYFEMIDNSLFNQVIDDYGFKHNEDAIGKYILGINIKDTVSRTRGSFKVGFDKEKQELKGNVSRYSIFSFSGLGGYDFIKSKKYTLLLSVGYEYSKYSYSLFSEKESDFYHAYGYWEDEVSFNSFLVATGFEYNFNAFQHSFFIGINFDYKLDLWRKNWTTDLKGTLPFNRRSLGTGIVLGYNFKHY